MHLPLLLLAYAGGLGCAPFLDFSPWFTGAACAAAGLWFPWRHRTTGTVALAAFSFFFGIAVFFQSTEPLAAPTDVRAFVADTPQVVQGEVIAATRRPEGASELRLEAGHIFIGGSAAAVHGRILLRIERGEPTVVAGDTVRFRARLRQPRIFATPGEFDYVRHLAAEGVFVTAFIEDGRDLAVFPAQDSFRFAALQTTARRLIDRSIDPETAPLVRALVIGDKGGISREQRDLLGRSGLSHLFSISGLHLGLIALFLYLLARALYCRSERLLLWAPPRRAIPALLLPALWFYLQLTGNALPTRRAFLMATVAAILLIICRRTPALRIVAAAAFILLLVSPLALFEPSFQLSFAGVAGILLVVPPWQERLAALPAVCRWPATLALTTLAATVATTPLTLLHFHLLAPAGLITNLAAVPAIGFLAVPLGLLGLVAAPWWPDAAAVALQGCALVIDAMLALAKQVTAAGFLAGRLLYLPPPQTVAVFALAGGLLLALGPVGRRRAGLVLLLAGALLCAIPLPSPRAATVTALSVGQGESILLSLPPGRHYLIDGGGAAAASFDVGARLLAPALGRLGVNRLDAVVLTHDHPDHRLGLLHILGNFPVVQFWTATPPDALDPELAAVLRSRDIPVRSFSPGWTPAADGLSVFVPPPENTGNDASLVIRAAHGRNAVLLTGDLEAKGVADLLRAAPAAAANLLKLPHHGSRKSQPAQLLDRFRPKIAFVSVGAGNSYRFPHDEVVTALKERQIPLYRTDLDGTLRFCSEGDGWHVEGWQKGRFRTLAADRLVGGR